MGSGLTAAPGEARVHRAGPRPFDGFAKRLIGLGACRCLSSPRPRASHSHTVVSATPASRHATVKVEPRLSAMVIVTCTVASSFVGRPLARAR